MTLYEPIMDLDLILVRGHRLDAENPLSWRGHTRVDPEAAREVIHWHAQDIYVEFLGSLDESIPGLTEAILQRLRAPDGLPAGLVSSADVFIGPSMAHDIDDESIMNRGIAFMAGRLRGAYASAWRRGKRAVFVTERSWGKTAAQLAGIPAWSLAEARAMRLRGEL